MFGAILLEIVKIVYPECFPFIIYTETATATSNLNSSTSIREKCKLTQEEIDLSMSKIDMSAINNWSPKEQKAVKDLIEYGSLFALRDMDLGGTDKIRHK